MANRVAVNLLQKMKKLNSIRSVSQFKQISPLNSYCVSKEYVGLKKSYITNNNIIKIANLLNIVCRSNQLQNKSVYSPLVFNCRNLHATRPVNMFIQTQDTPNPNSLKFLPGMEVRSHIKSGSIQYKNLIFIFKKKCKACKCRILFEGFRIEYDGFPFRL